MRLRETTNETSPTQPNERFRHCVFLIGQPNNNKWPIIFCKLTTDHC
jgi:hypothetical protein